MITNSFDFLFPVQAALYPMMAVLYKYCLGYVVLTCIVEINSVFLHIRRVLLMYDSSNTSLRYQIINFFYVLTFFIVRMPAFIITLVTLLQDRERMPASWSNSFIAGTIVLIYVNIYFFKRILTSNKLFN